MRWTKTESTALPETTQSLFKRFASAAWLGVLLCLAGLVVHASHLLRSQPPGWVCCLGMILFGNFMWWDWVRRFVSGSHDAKQRSRLRAAILVLCGIYIAVMLVPVILGAVRRTWWGVWPGAAVSWIMAWDLLIGTIAVPVSLGLLIRRMRRHQRHTPSVGLLRDDDQALEGHRNLDGDDVPGVAEP